METIDIFTSDSPEATITGVARAAQQASQNLVILDDRLKSLQLNFGKLRSAISRAFAPIAGAIAPMLADALRTLTDFFDSVGAVMAALFGTVYKKAVTTTKAAGAAIKRTLTSFDDIERLNGGGSGGGSTSLVTLEPVNDLLTPSLQKVVDFIRAAIAKIGELLAPLKQIDLTPAADAFGRFGAAIAQLGATIGGALEWVWHNLLVPLATWTIEELVPASVDALTEAFKLLAAILPPLVEGIKQILPALQPVARFIGESLLLFIQSLGQQFQKLAQVFADKAPQIQTIFSNITQIITALWTKAEPVLLELRSSWAEIIDGLGTDTASGISTIIDDLAGLTAFLAQALTGDWSALGDGLKGILKGTVNGIIGFLNRLMSGLASTLNSLAGILNGWSVTIPDWVPELGGRSFGFHIGTVTAPQIPYLARGAVLPAGKPFLAMVGDQRHGTNIEAPLATIQEAVAMTVEDMARSNLAGHEATVRTLEQILAAVLDIHIGDDAVASAADRSYARRAVMKGAAYAP